LDTAGSDIIRRDFIKRLGAGRRRLFALRMAPMIDIIFLLLIFFLVAAKWRPQENFLPFQLPAVQAEQINIARAEPLVMQITETSTGCQVQIGMSYTIQVENETIEENLVVLAEKMKDCLVEQKRFTSDPIEIVCGPLVKWEHLTRIYNVLYGAGLTDITFRMTE